MALIKSISGFRGTIGGEEGTALTPPDIIKFTSAYAAWIKHVQAGKLIIVGRDGRMSGGMVRDLVVATLQACGLDVMDLGLSTTPTVEMAVPYHHAAGGIILTASHNPKEWNALKLLNAKGEFISSEQGAWILREAEKGNIAYASVTELGKVLSDKDSRAHHIQAILQHPLVDVEAIRARSFSIVVDGINSSGAIFVPYLLQLLGVEKTHVINAEMHGDFAHNPEPLPEHLKELSASVVAQGAALGIAVDPDVDRLCFVSENGELFGEEYTLVAVADYVLQHKKGNTVSNMSSTRALRDVTEKHGGIYTPSAVGEVNVVEKMKATNAVIGGEGNGGIIVPDLHYGRDALIGIALFLSHLAKSGRSASELRNTYPQYVISKNKIDLEPGMDVLSILKMIQEKFAHQPINTEDGLKIEFDKDWVHLRSSNTEPIIRIYAESTSAEKADALAHNIMQEIDKAASQLAQ